MAESDFEPYDYEVNEVNAIKAFFKKIARTLNYFAERHNLNIEKYYHRGPSWHFLFRHPQGGTCYVEVRMFDENHVKLCSDWSVYDIDTGISYDKHTQLTQCSIREIEIKNKLEEMLSLVLSWNLENLEIVAKRSPEVKEQWTKEELEKDLERYPNPRF